MCSVTSGSATKSREGIPQMKAEESRCRMEVFSCRLPPVPMAVPATAGDLHLAMEEAGSCGKGARLLSPALSLLPGKMDGSRHTGELETPVNY